MSVLPEAIKFTQVPNFLLDEHMCEFKGSETKVVLAICRKTYGFQKTVDRVALSQIRELTGLGKNTIIKALRSLVRRKIIKKYDETTPHQYSMILPEIIDTSAQKTNKPNSKNGSENELSGVQKSNQPPVQKLNTQKKVPKENLKETTTSSDLSDDFFEVVEFWNKTFNGTLNNPSTKLVKNIHKAITVFGVDYLKKAITNRSRARYYLEQKPELLDKPTAFFPYPDTIENDANRKPEGIITYEKMVDIVTPSGLTTSDFEMVDHLDSEGKRMWRKKYNG